MKDKHLCSFIKQSDNHLTFCYQKYIKNSAATTINMNRKIPLRWLLVKYSTLFIIKMFNNNKFGCSFI